MNVPQTDSEIPHEQISSRASKSEIMKNGSIGSSGGEVQQPDDRFQAAVLDALPALIAVLNERGVILFVNEAWRRAALQNEFLGSEFGVGQNYLEIWERAQSEYAEHAHAAVVGIRKVIEGVAPEVSIEYPFHAPEEQRWYRLTVTPLQETSCRGAVVMHANITERKLAAQRLRRNEARYRALVENSFDAVAVLAPTGVVSYASPAVTKVLGYSLEDFVGRNAFEIVHPEDLDAYQRLFTAVVERPGNKACAEYRTEHQDGSWRWVEVVAQNFIDHPEIHGVVCNFRDITRTKEMLDELRSSEERSQGIVLSALDAIITIDHENRITDFNPAAERVFGHRRADVLGRDMGEVIVPPSMREVHRRGIARFLNTGETVIMDRRLELTAIRADGSEFPIELTATRLGRTSPPSFVGFIRDITEQRRAEESIRLQAYMLNNIGQAIIATNPKGQIVYANRFAEELYGWSLDDMRGKSVCDVIAPQTTEEQAEQIAISLREGRSWSGELPVKRSDGSIFPACATYSPMHDEHGKLSGFIGISTDITERKRFEEQIVEQAALIDEAQDAIVLRDLKHRIKFWSKGAERLYGWTAEEAKGRYFDEFLQVDTVKFKEAEKTLLENGAWSGEIHNTTHAGSNVTLHSRWTLLRDPSNQPRSILSFDSDITEHKKLETQFLRAQRMESIGTLAGGIAHDLNNVLAPILISADVLKTSVSDPGDVALLQAISESVERGAKMVQQVLSFARGVDGERAEVDTKKLLLQVAKIAEDTFPKSIRVRTNIAADLQNVSADATQLHQVLLNLCVNARDAMPHGGSLTLSARNVIFDEHYAAMNIDAKEGPYLLLEVEDSGTGIAKETIEQIFDPFFTTKEVGKGTGLGLSTSMAIVKSHGGFIRVYSEVGKGSTFRVYLPSQRSAEIPELSEKAASLPQGSGELILVVDDEAFIRKIIRHTLEKNGYRVLVASDGAEALALYASHREKIDIVLTDMMMPVLDGAAMIRALIKLDPDVQVIATSGLTTSLDAAKALGPAVKCFLQKPYTATGLLETLAAVLQAGHVSKS